MELVSTITARTRASAGLEEDGSLSLKVFAEAEYAPGMTTTAEVQLAEIDPEKADAVKAALAAVLVDEGVNALLGDRLPKAVLKSAEISAAHGEI